MAEDSPQDDLSPALSVKGQSGDEPWLGGSLGMQPLLDALRSGDNNAIRKASTALTGYGSAAIPRLVEYLAHPDYRVRAVMAHALSRLEVNAALLDALPALVNALRDPAQSVRVVAAAAIDRIAAQFPKEAAPAIEAVRQFRRR